jgi:small GTP-binding protein
MSESLTFKVLKEENKEYNCSFKIIVVGDSGVGKSSITLKATKNEFNDCYNSTVGFEFCTFNIQIENTIIRLQIWDTCGQEIYRSLISSFYQTCGLAILVYSVDNAESFKSIPFWFKEIKNQSHPDIKLILVGNKTDLSDKREVSTEEGEQFAKENEMDLFLETSAKSGFNAQNLFIEVGKMMYLEHQKYSQMGKHMSFGKTNTDKNNHLQPKPKEKDKADGCQC